MLLEGDFQCSVEMGIPHRAKSGSSEVCLTLQVPNGEPLVNLHIGNGRVFSGSPGFRGRIISSSPLKMLNDIQARGELKIILINLGKQAFVVNNGERIAQIIVSPVTVADFKLTDSLSDTKRGEKGFGSTGV